MSIFSGSARKESQRSIGSFKLKLPNLHLFDAIDGSKLLDFDKLREKGILKEKKKWLGKIGQGSVGCALSHISVMHKIKMQLQE